MKKQNCDLCGKKFSNAGQFQEIGGEFGICHTHVDPLYAVTYSMGFQPGGGDADEAVIEMVRALVAAKPKAFFNGMVRDTDPQFFVCYRSTEGFEMYLQTTDTLLFAHHHSNGLGFVSQEAATDVIESFRGRYRDQDLATLYVCSK